MSTGHDTNVVLRRIVAELVDLVVTLVVTLAFAVVVLAAVGGLGEATGGGDVAAALGLVGVLAVGVVALLIGYGYNVVLELAWDGRTVGKRLTGIRVVETDGTPPDLVPVAVRNLPAVVAGLLGALVVYPLILPVGLAAIFISGEDQRVFDVFAGTLVVRD
jgi:uncharacterized RDD family membrane protein YckC